MTPPRRHLLVINPNTTASVSALLQRHAQAAAGADVAVRTVTARFGAPYIACEASYAVAGHAALDAWARALVADASVAGEAATGGDAQAATEPGGHAPPDAVLIGCFGDPGLLALRDSSAVPVTGLAEASFIAAARLGRFAIVTGGERWAPMLERLALVLGQAPALAGVHTVAPTGAQLAADPVAARGLLAQACREAAERWDVQSVVLGGAGLAGLAALIQPQLSVPVIDSVLAGTRQALAWCDGALNGAPEAGTARSRPGFDVPWVDLSPAMQRLGLPAGA